MILYYQAAENSKQRWQQIEDTQEEAIRRETAFHMSIYKLDRAVEEAKEGDIKYKGDLWFDIDHKPEGSTPSPDDYRRAIHEAILDTRKLLSYFDSIHLDTQCCLLFASGGKGFHLCVPASLFDATSAVKSLPRLHKFMAQMIQHRAETTGIDMATYSEGKGHLLRVENKQRANGKYKVPITLQELEVMTPESYALLTSAPRVVTTYAPKGSCAGLAILYSEAEAELENVSKIAFSAATEAHMAVFSDHNNPLCVDWVVEGTNIKPDSGKFNRAKMSLARYLMNSLITDEERNRLLSEFANNWTSTHNPTVESRQQAVRETLKYGKENGFSCSLMTSMMTASPCKGCKLKAVQRQEVASLAKIEATANGYIRITPKGDGPELSNFTLVPYCKVMKDNEDKDNEFAAFEYIVLRGTTEIVEGDKLVVITLKHSAWQSSSEFKKQISSTLDLRWTGGDIDLQHLKSLLTNPVAIEGIKTVTEIKRIGINRYIDAARDIDEYVWVEEGFSINALGTTQTMRFDPDGTGTDTHRALRLSGVEPYNSADEKQNETLRALLKVNTPDIVAPTLGWIMSCWLRAHIRSRETTEKHLPSLQIYGSSGHGKTETATLFAILAGADYYTNEPLVVSSATPFAIRIEASISTTIPRIFDEMNEHKISDRKRYSAAREAVKASARAGAQPQGVVSDRGLRIDDKRATSPIIMLATQLNAEREIHERTIPLSINKVHRDADHAVNFRLARKNIQHLISLAKSSMLTTLEIDDAWIIATTLRNQALMPPAIQDRIATNWETALIGLDYLTYVLQGRRGNARIKARKSAPQDILDRVAALKQELLDWLQANERELSEASEAQEIDAVLDTFGEMIILDTGYNRKFKYGEHYVVAGDTLHIWSSAFFPQYLKHCRQVLMRPPELSSVKQYLDLLQHQPYCMASCPPEGVKSPRGWHSFHIPSLVERNIRVENFLVD